MMYPGLLEASTEEYSVCVVHKCVFSCSYAYVLCEFALFIFVGEVFSSSV